MPVYTVLAPLRGGGEALFNKLKKCCLKRDLYIFEIIQIQLSSYVVKRETEITKTLIEDTYNENPDRNHSSSYREHFGPVQSDDQLTQYPPYDNSLIDRFIPPVKDVL